MIEDAGDAHRAAGPALAVDVRLRLGRLDLDVAFTAGPGPTLLVGPNGAGKSSLLRLVAGALRPDAGRVTLGDRVLVDAEAGRGAPPELRRVAYLPQDYGLFPHLTAEENVAFAVRASRRRRERRARARAMLEELGVAEVAAARPATLSGGQRQRVALARALAAEPEALLLDEPLAALDVVHKDRVRAFLVRRLRDLGLPSLVITHDPADVRAFDAPMLVLDAGRVVQRGPAAALGAAPINRFVEALFPTAPRAAPHR